MEMHRDIPGQGRIQCEFNGHHDLASPFMDDAKGVLQGQRHVDAGHMNNVR